MNRSVKPAWMAMGPCDKERVCCIIISTS